MAYFDTEGNENVLKILEDANRNHTKLRVWYGDKKTGRDWGEIYDTFGYIGRSCGTKKIPLLLKRKDSMWGGAILADCIVKITIDKKCVYQHPMFNQPKYRIEEASKSLQKNGYGFSVFAGDSNIFNCKTRKQAENEVAFHLGIRNVA